MAQDVIRLIDKESGSEAFITAQYGFNCFKWTANIEDQQVPVLWSVDDFENGEGRPSGNGIPILFPYPGRIKDAKFTWQGEDYQLEEADGAGNAIHGFVHTRAWRVINQTENSVTGQFQASVDDPSILERWPTDFLIEVTYQLTDNQLTGTYKVKNPSDKALPFGLGTHAYYRVPLSDNGNADTCEITVPYSYEWNFENLMASGERTQRFEPSATKMVFADTGFDNAFGGLEFVDGVCTTTIEDPQSGRKLTQTFTNDFTAVVLYNPPHREAFCIEPYTYVPDPYQLEKADIKSGLRVLEPGEEFSTEVKITVE